MEGTPSLHTHVLPEGGVSIQKATPLPSAGGIPRSRAEAWGRTDEDASWVMKGAPGDLGAPTKPSRSKAYILEVGHWGEGGKVD